MKDKGECVFGACGKFHTVVVMANGEAYAWGFNGMGQTGTGEVKLWVRTGPRASVWCTCNTQTQLSMPKLICVQPARLENTGKSGAETICEHWCIASEVHVHDFSMAVMANFWLAVPAFCPVGALLPTLLVA